jgi:hypothetical protein
LCFFVHTHTQQETIQTKNQIRKELFSKKENEKKKKESVREKDLHNNKKKKKNTTEKNENNKIYGIDVYYLLVLLFFSIARYTHTHRGRTGLEREALTNRCFLIFVRLQKQKKKT